MLFANKILEQQKEKIFQKVTLIILQNKHALNKVFSGFFFFFSSETFRDYLVLKKNNNSDGKHKLSRGIWRNNYKPY